jgi:thioredoxin-dependent peroxiredoxin
MADKEKLQVGNVAPDFELPDQDGQTVRLADYRNKFDFTVLVFYISDLNPDSPGQMASVREVYGDLEKLNAGVLGISKSGDEAKRDFATKNKLIFPLLTDHDNAVAISYGLQGGFGPLKTIKRGVVVMNKGGQIIYYRQGDHGMEEVVKMLQQQFATPR